jgi:hypothetical protein
MLDLPRCDLQDPAALEAFFGRNALAQHWRKVVLAHCRELERGKAAVASTKTTEARLDDLARQHDFYLEYLGFMVIGATAYAKAWQDAATR